MGLPAARARSVSIGLAAAGLLILAAVAVRDLAARWNWERDRAVELCVDGEELRALAAADPAAWPRALSRLDAAGVRSLAAYWDGVEPLDSFLARWTDLPPGFSLTLRPRPGPFAPPPAASLPVPSRVTALLCAGPVVWGFPDADPLARWVARTPWTLPWVEFIRQPGAEALLRRFPDRTVRAHSFDEEEMSRALPAQAAARFRRAVRERGVRFLYLRFFPGLSLERNLAYVESLAAGLRADGFRPGPARLRRREWKSSPPAPSARRALALLAACLLPVLGLRWALRRPSVPAAALGLTAWSLAAALLVAGLLSTADFALGFERFRGVKLSLFLPLLGAAALLYGREELRRLSQKPLTFGTAALLLLAAGVIGIYLLRSGHESFLRVSGSEHRFRQALETFFGVRPRFKEFLIGHPLLWLGFYLMRNAECGLRIGNITAGKEAFRFRIRHSASRIFKDPRPFILAGFIGQLSLINTFCHPHVPLAVSLLRTFHGIWLGAAGGMLLIAAARALRGRAALAG